VKLGLDGRGGQAADQAERIEAQMVSGEAVDPRRLCTVSSTVVRLAFFDNKSRLFHI